MPAFDPILSGLPSLDEALDSIRLGDNVVWRVSDLQDFSFFAQPFAEQCLADGRKTFYIRFSAHSPLVTSLPGLHTVHLDPSQGFESFTVRVHEIVTAGGREACYIFDCLSDLQEAWSTDLMMGNFFQVTCPYLFQLDTVAYFPVLRGMHSQEALARIRETTQLLLDVYSDDTQRYLTPLKIWKRYSADMFLPHQITSDGTLEPLNGWHGPEPVLQPAR